MTTSSRAPTDDRSEVPIAPSARAHAGNPVVRRVARWQGRFPLLQLLALIVIVIYGAASIPGYDSTPSLKSMLVLAALLGLAALPQTLVVLLGGIDLSIPAFIAVGGVMTTELGGGHQWPLYEVLALIIVVCAAGGALSGFLCHRFKANPLIVTLGMYAIFEGAILIWTKGNIGATPPVSLTNWTSVTGTTAGIGVPPVVVVWAAVAVTTGLVLARTAPGRRLYATGTNLRAARIALLRTELIWTIVFMLSAVLSGLAGVLVAGYTSGASPGMGDPYLFQGLTAVIVGGTAIGSARGDYWRTVLGSLILTALTTVLIGKGFDANDTQILFGFVILIVVAAYGRERRVRERV
jgi:ribose transport system permease protein